MSLALEIRGAVPVLVLVPAGCAETVLEFSDKFEAIVSSDLRAMAPGLYTEIGS